MTKAGYAGMTHQFQEACQKPGDWRWLQAEYLETVCLKAEEDEACLGQQCFGDSSVLQLLQCHRARLMPWPTVAKKTEAGTVSLMPQETNATVFMFAAAWKHAAVGHLPHFI